MEASRWEQKLQALTHILTHPTTTPTLHSQLFISYQIPSYLNWDYPPLLIHPTWSWAFSHYYLKRLLLRVGGGPTLSSSWRAKCPYQQPPPLVLACGLNEAKWGDEDRREYVRKRLTRNRLGSDIHPLFPILLPNAFLLSLLFWNPFPLDAD